MKRILILSALLIGTFVHASVTSDKDSVSLKVMQLTSSPYEDFSAVPFGEKLIYVSSRNTDIQARSYSVNDQGYFQLYAMDLNSHKVSDFKFMDKRSAFKFHNGPITFLSDSSGAFYSRNYIRPNLDDDVNFYIGFVDFESGKSYRLPFIRRAFNYQHPYYDDANRRLYFTSDMPGGVGGYDLYYVNVDEDGLVGEPVNVQEVNTSQNELFPTTNKAGELFFSRYFKDSGLDILKLDAKSNQIIRLSSPYNSKGDDHSLIFLQGDSAVFTQGAVSKFNSDIFLVYNESKVKESGLEIVQNLIAVKEEISLENNSISESKVAESIQDSTAPNNISPEINEQFIAQVENAELNAVIEESKSQSSSDIEAEKELQSEQIWAQSSKASNATGENATSGTSEAVNAEDDSYAVIAASGETTTSSTVTTTEESDQSGNTVASSEMDVLASVETTGSTEGVESINDSKVNGENATSGTSEAVNAEDDSNAVIAASGETTTSSTVTTSEESDQSGNTVASSEMDVLVTSEPTNNGIPTSIEEDNLTNEAAESFDWSSSWDKSFTLAELSKILPKVQVEQERTYTLNYASGQKQLTESQLLDLRNAMARSGSEVLSVSIEGHTDNNGSAALNERVALQRALNVRGVLTESFDISESQTTVVSWGESKPKNDCVDCDESEAKENRRVEVKITEKVWREDAALMSTIESRAERLLSQDSLALAEAGSVYSPNAKFRLSDLLDASELNLSKSRSSESIANGTVHFASGQVYLSSEEQAKLKEELSKVKGHKLRVTLVAHNDGIGDFASNKERSLARAMAVQYFLYEQLKGTEIAFEVETFDGEFPAVQIGDGSRPSRLAANENRRVEFKIEPVLETDLLAEDSQANIYFDFDGVNVKSSYSDLIKDLAVNTKPNEEIVLIGYTDSRGSEIYNYGLSLKRAQEVQNEILSLNPSLSGRIRVIAKGESGASAAKNSKDHALNRKVEIIKTASHE